MLRGIVIVVAIVVGSSIGKAGVARVLVGQRGEGVRRGLDWGVGERMERNLVVGRFGGYGRE